MVMVEDISVDGLNRQCFIQLQFCLEVIKDQGTYYGCKKYFDARHEKLEKWVEQVLTNTAGMKFKG